MNQFGGLLIRLDALQERLDARKKAADGQMELFNNKGEPCGDGWIARDKTCHKSSFEAVMALTAIEPTFKKKVRELEATADGVLGKYKKQIDEYYKTLADLEVAHTKATDDVLSADGPSKRLKAKKRLRDVADQVRDNEYKLIGVMENIMNDMKKTKLSERDLMVLPQTINFSDWGAATGGPKGQVKEFARMFNGRGLSPYNGVQGVHKISPQAQGNRAYNNLGHVVTTKGAETIMFHELMHSVEHQRPWMAQYAKDWAAGKAVDESSEQMPEALRGSSIGNAKGKPLYQLAAITGDTSYRAEEVAWADDYLNPYMGKNYSKPPTMPASTEVWTIAAEHFTHPMLMAKFYKKHPDLFKVMVGLSQTTDD